MIYITSVITFITLLYGFVLLVNKIRKGEIKKTKCFTIVFYLLVLFSFIYVLYYFKVFSNEKIIEYMTNLKSFTQYILLILAISFVIYILIGFFGKKYTLRVENFNIGGINVFFDKSNEIYVKTVGNFIKSKRTLFCFNKAQDNIRDVIETYYSVYNFIRNNIELLDPDVDVDLYSISIDILKNLNKFLTKHQSDYRRWYENIIEKDVIKCKNGSYIVVHETTIEEVQKHYYRYYEILDDLKLVNNYMKNKELSDTFNINNFDWESDVHA